MTREPWQVDDGARNYAFAVACARERRVRRGEAAPHPGDAREARWAAEGERAELDTVKDWKP